jgi:tripartite-type tricarboxylate transporter receptor subunit TctC
MEPCILAQDPTNPLRRRLLIGAAGATLGTLCGGARALAASDYPSKPLRVVIPYPPGGPTDIVGRIVAATLADKLGQSVVIDNRPGASGMIGADAVAKAAPDGYVLLINVSGQLVNPALYANMSHDPLKDFRGITNLASTPIQLVVSANSPVRSVADLVALVRSQPGRHNFASSSNGTPGHLAGEGQRAGADRCDRRPGHLHAGFHAVVDQPGQGRQAARTRRHLGQARGRLA